MARSNQRIATSRKLRRSLNARNVDVGSLHTTLQGNFVANVARRNGRIASVVKLESGDKAHRLIVCALFSALRRNPLKLMWASLSLVFAEIDAYDYGKDRRTADLIWTIVMFLLFAYYMYGWLHHTESRGGEDGGDVHKGGL